jgi:hypothetical protein
VAARFASRPPRADRQAVSLVLGHVGRRARAAPGVHWPRDRVVGLGNECGVTEVPPTAVRTGQSWGRLPAAAPALPVRQTAAAAVATMLSDGSAEDAAHAAA